MTAVVHAQETIPQVAARSSEPFYRTRTRELAPAPFAHIVTESDLIVRGIVQPKSTYLSRDEQEIYTDYDVLPLETYAARVGTAHKPGAAGIVVQHYGGRMTFGNIYVEAIDTNLPPFPAGSELVLFLKME